MTSVTSVVYVLYFPVSSGCHIFVTRSMTSSVWFALSYRTDFIDSLTVFRVSLLNDFCFSLLILLNFSF